jgi:membrane associated rhomboid family serine protease
VVSALATLAALVSGDVARSLILIEGFNDGAWKLLTTGFVYPAGSFGGTMYELIALASIFLFGWLLERRHGAWAPLLVFLVGTVGGLAVSYALPGSLYALGANGGALALLGAWVVRDLLALRRGEEIESDMLGVVAIAIVLALLPAAITVADPVAGAVGAVVGLMFGLIFSRLPQR